jgi:hypothetical protein
MTSSLKSLFNFERPDLSSVARRYEISKLATEKLFFENCTVKKVEIITIVMISLENQL